MGLPLLESSPCRDCLAGCCRGLTVEIIGFDAVRIARALAIPLRDFVELRYTDEADPRHCVIIDGPSGEPLYCRLVLSRVPSGRQDLPLRCTFLLEIGDVGRCGVGPLRPLVCRVYPFHLRDGALRLDETAAFCPPGGWRLEDGDLARLVFKRRQSAIYHHIVAAWNRRAPRTQPAFYQFLLEIYAALPAEWFDEDSAIDPEEIAITVDRAAR